MVRKVVCSILFVAVAAVGAHAADGKDAAPVPRKDRPSPSGAPSYFEGEWVGAWPAWSGTSAAQDVTVKIERGVKQGVFRVEYSWGATTLRRGIIPAGSVRTRGREEDDRIVFKWTNKRGNDVEVTLRKHDTNAVKARMEKSGPLESGERPYLETMLNRK